VHAGCAQCRLTIGAEASESDGAGGSRQLRKRATTERKCAGQKNYHGLRQAHCRGSAKITMQARALVVCMMANCKRLVRLQTAMTDSARGGLCPNADSGR